jgi:hypothetical protein
MTKTEHLIACLAEEAGELVQACGKALRFGVDRRRPGSTYTNAEQILEELAHIKAVAHVLNLTPTPNFPSEGRMVDEKLAVLHSILEYARRHNLVFDGEE